MELRTGDTLGIIDCGTGACGLGSGLAGAGDALKAYLFLSHLHWDHIQGFPFFLPAFLPTAELEVFGSPGLEHGLEAAMAGQMQYTYFPVRLHDLRSQLTFHEVGEETFRAGLFTVSTQYLNHSAPTTGYRISAGDVTVAYLSDHEPFWPHDVSRPLEEILLHPADRRHVDFAAGADLLIHDSQYTAEEYPARRGWGHSTIEYVVDVACAAGVKRLALFHHDPSRSDDAIDELVGRAGLRAQLRGAQLEILAAAEGLELELPELAAPSAAAPLLPSSAKTSLARVLLLGGQEHRARVRDALVEEGYQFNEAALESPTAAWASMDADLIVVAADGAPEAPGVLETIRRHFSGSPVLAVLDEADQPALRRVRGLATDVIEASFAPPNLRARVRACLARATPRPPRADSYHALDALPSSEFARLFASAADCAFRPGEVLFLQGDPPAGVYYLHSGRVRIAQEAPDGKEVALAYAGPGDTVGEMAALDEGPRSATVVAVEPVVASYIAREEFVEALRRAPDAAMRILRLLVQRLRATDIQVGALNGTEPN